MISGDNGWRVPPVPIPNTEVKPPCAEGTWLETARETMSLPDSIKDRSDCFGPFSFAQNKLAAFPTETRKDCSI